MKVVLLTNDAPNQKALAWKIHQAVGLKALVVERRNVTGKKKSALERLRHAVETALTYKINSTWHQLMRHYANGFPAFPEVNTVNSTNINDDETYEAIGQLEPDLIAVSGTSLIKTKLLSLNPPLGFINLHTGLSPYVKGGPNCTNWCIVTEQWHLIGNTVMWIDAGIDSGNLITTETTPLSGDESFLELHIKVMDHAHDLYVRAIQQIVKDKSAVPNMPQRDIAEGTTYYTRAIGLLQIA
jgi:methionyl-tRNA formyltransferase